MEICCSGSYCHQYYIGEKVGEIDLEIAVSYLYLYNIYFENLQHPGPSQKYVFYFWNWNWSRVCDFGREKVMQILMEAVPLTLKLKHFHLAGFYFAKAKLETEADHKDAEDLVLILEYYQDLLDLQVQNTTKAVALML